MRDQVIGIYVVPFIAQVLAPLLLLTWLAIGSERSRAGWLIRAVSVAAYILSIAIAGLWLVVPWYLSAVYALILVALALSKLRRIEKTGFCPNPPGNWIAFLICGALAACSIGLVLYAIDGRQPPNEDFVDLAFPLQHGTYFVAGGGSNELLNPHVKTLTTDRFSDYRGQSYGIDIVEINAIGMRAEGTAPRDPRKYFIFGASVYAPCSGIVLRAEDGFPDMPPPEPDRTHLTGNYVFLDCSGRHILLGHLQKGTVRVRPGDSVTVGTVLGQVGNSGNTGEPHLHIHAQRRSANGAFMSGDPLPIRLDGRFLARNDWVRQDVGLFAPPIGGLIALLAVFVLGLVYCFPMRRWFRGWGAGVEELKRPMAADAEIANPNYRTTLGITIDAPPAAIWPWLVQMGYRRGGLYSYDWLDRCFGYLDGPSAERVLPEFQQLAVGDVIPLGAGPGFPVKAIEPRRTLLLGGRVEDVNWAWQFELLSIDESHTRLISRNCVRGPRSWKGAVLILLIEPTAFIMTRKMLLGLKRRVENRQRPNLGAPLTQRAFYGNWIVANGWAEAIGLGGTLVTGYLAAPFLQTPTSGLSIIVGSLAAVISGTFLEGVVVGAAQERVLRNFSRDIPRHAWTRATAIGALFAWAVGMIPSTLFSLLDTTETAHSAVVEPSPMAQYGLAVILGIVAGPILGFAQARVLRRVTENSNKWLLANAAAWAIGMPVIFAGMDLIPWASGRLAVITGIVAVCSVTGLVVGAVHGCFLTRLISRTDSSASQIDWPNRAA